MWNFASFTVLIGQGLLRAISVYDESDSEVETSNHSSCSEEHLRLNIRSGYLEVHGFILSIFVSKGTTYESQSSCG